MADTRKSPVKRYLILSIAVVAVVGVVCAYGFYQADIELFFKLRAWDRGAPGRVVTSFLNAAKRGDAAEADRNIDTSTFHPLKKEDQTVGYFIATPAGTMDFLFSELAPEGEVKVASVRFILLGEGATEVIVPWRKGDGKFRLKMKNGMWKITDILSAGRVRGR